MHTHLPLPRPTQRTLATLLLAVACLPWGLTTHAADPTDNGTPTSATASYKEVVLKDLVEKSRTEIPGQRIIFAPASVKFQARLASLPSPQKTEYLSAALAMMQVSAVPKVSQRIGLDYGGDKALAAYIDDSAAARLGQSAKPGQKLTFYAFHVYNNNRGPALVVTSFAE